MLDAIRQSTLRIGLFRFTIAPLQPLMVPAMDKGNMLRGGFGHAFRRLCCVPQCKDAKTCPLTRSCPYKVVFEPSPPAGADRLSKNQDIPRPFMFRAPHTKQTRFELGQRFDFGLVLVGHALDFLPYFVLSFRELAAAGLGLNRARCSLERVEHVKSIPSGTGPEDSQPELIYTSEEERFRANETVTAGEWIKRRLDDVSTRNGDRGVQRVTIRFLTPTFLRADGEIIRRPEFHHVFKRLRDRINALSAFYGDGPLDVDFQVLGKRAEEIRTISARFGWAERYRTSSRTHRTHELSGVVGEGMYEGEVQEFLPWLALGELTGLGRHAAFGNGVLNFTSHVPRRRADSDVEAIA